jgi:uncharacterized DUF497 family protein
MKFEWDTKKSITNERKHLISFSEAASVFGDPLAITFPDPDSSKKETRFLVFGISKFNKLLVVSYTERKDTVRIISAREVTRYERRIYEDG